jgi:hypothetical protein
MFVGVCVCVCVYIYIYARICKYYWVISCIINLDIDYKTGLKPKETFGMRKDYSVRKKNSFYYEWKNVELNSFGVGVYDKALTFEIGIPSWAMEMATSFHLLPFSMKAIHFLNGIAIPRTKRNLSILGN